jgi:hypothetical protein
MDPMPHQRRVWDVALEVDQDGQFVYRTVVFSIPRQAGKTSALRALTTWWGITRPSSLIISTAQTGGDARVKFLESYEDIERRPFFARQMKGPVRKANGTEVCKWKSGSRHRPAPPVPTKGHGDTLDLGVIDEAWSFKDEAVITSMRPAMMTRNSQLWLVSTAGTDDSVLLRRHVEMGRRAVAGGQNSGLAFFEWAAGDDQDPDDERTWWSCIPSLGRTVSIDRIAADKETLQPGDFERSYLNRWSEASLDTVIPWGTWLLLNEPSPVVDEPWWLCADINPERTQASIVAAGSNADGTKVACKVLDVRAGTEWLPQRIEQLRANHDIAGVVIDGTGPAATLELDLTEPPELLKYGEVTVACQSFFDSMINLGVTFQNDVWLTAAMRNVVQLGNGDRWRWTRKRSRGDISPLMAATLSWWKARAELGAPSLRIY